MIETLHGDVDKIMKVKVPLTIEHIFDSKRGMRSSKVHID